MSCKIFAIVNTKGGVGKTTFTANLGGILADMGKKVLLIDSDFQPSLSSHYEITQQSQHGLIEFITLGLAKECISKTSIKNLDIILSNDPDLTLITWLRQGSTHFLYLANSVNEISESGDYDYILIDSEGVSKSELQESVIVSADVLLAPLSPDYKPAREFSRGFIRTLNRVKPPKLMENMYSIPPTKVFFNAKDRTNDNKAVIEEIRCEFESGTIHGSEFEISIMDTLIPDMAAYNKACGLRQPVHRVERKRINGSPTPCALETMLSLVHELCPELIGTEPVIPAFRGK